MDLLVPTYHELEAVFKKCRPNTQATAKAMYSWCRTNLGPLRFDFEIATLRGKALELEREQGQDRIVWS